MIPNTSAGRRFVEWQEAQDSGDPAAIQDFINKSMPFGRVEQELSIHNRSGGYDIKRFVQSSDTLLIVLAQERGPARQFARISFSVQGQEPYQVAGIGIQTVQPPPDLAPQKMTECCRG